MNILTFFPLIP